jgi:peptide deformylase
MAVREILLLGNPKLYEQSTEIESEELEEIKKIIRDLRDTLFDFKGRFGAGRAIAAPQIGVMKRLIYMHVDKPIAFINPRIDFQSLEKIEVWDDCMCFPDLLVKVLRFKSCQTEYLDLNWNKVSMNLEGDLSELFQHEYDHLDGILAVERAIDGKSFSLRSRRRS